MKRIKVSHKESSLLGSKRNRESQGTAKIEPARRFYSTRSFKKNQSSKYCRGQRDKSNNGKETVPVRNTVDIRLRNGSEMIFYRATLRNLCSLL